MKFFATAIALIASVSAIKIETEGPATSTTAATAAGSTAGTAPAFKCYEMS